MLSSYFESIDWWFFNKKYFFDKILRSERLFDAFIKKKKVVKIFRICSPISERMEFIISLKVMNRSLFTFYKSW